MNNSRERRVTKELRDIKNDAHSGVTARLKDDNDLLNLEGVIQGPPDTPYAGGTYILNIALPPEYPFRPPKITFKTPIFHANVSSVTGFICLDILSSNWSPVQNLKTVLISIRLLLQCPNPDDPQDAVAAKMLVSEPQKFYRIANEWAVRHAGAPVQSDASIKKNGGAPRQPPDYGGWNEEVINHFADMGFTVPDILKALDKLGVDNHDGRYFRIDDGLSGDIIAVLLGDI